MTVAGEIRLVYDEKLTQDQHQLRYRAATAASEFRAGTTVVTSRSPTEPRIIAAGNAFALGYIDDLVPHYADDARGDGRALRAQAFNTTAGAAGVALAQSGKVAFIAWTDNRGSDGDGANIRYAERRNGLWRTLDLAVAPAYQYFQVLDVHAVASRATVTFVATSPMAREQR